MITVHIWRGRGVPDQRNHTRSENAADQRSKGFWDTIQFADDSHGKRRANYAFNAYTKQGFHVDYVGALKHG